MVEIKNLHGQTLLRLDGEHVLNLGGQSFARVEGSQLISLRGQVLADGANVGTGMRVEGDAVLDRYGRPAASVTGGTLEQKRVLAAAFAVFCTDG